MTEYRFLTGTDNELLSRQVTEYLNDGWELYGSATLAVKELTVIYGQAVTRTMTQKQGFTPTSDDKY